MHPLSPHAAIVVVLVVAASNCLSAQQRATASPEPAPETREPRPQTEEALIADLIARMSIEEKLGQLNQYTGQWSLTGPTVRQGGEERIRRGQVGSFLNVYGARTTRRLQRMAVEESRLGIPLLFGYDVIHGFRTIFPVPLAEACSWNPELATRTARIAAVEATAAGLHWTFAPMVDIARDPRWGRIVEGAGEDPYLGSVFAAARVRGFQGEDLAAHDTLMACAKHFAAYGGAEAGRDYNPVDISVRTLREVYLPPFKAALDAGVGSFMAAFNEIGGVPATADRFLLTELLRDEWGFEGFVVSDYTAVLELIQHGVAGSRVEAGILALKAGIDMDMISGIYVDDLPEAVRDGRVDAAAVDAAVRRVLRAKYRLGLFEDPYRYCDPAREDALLLAPEHRAAAREAARESIVLLKNEGNVLPLSKQLRTLAVIGPLANDALTVLGSWSAAGRGPEAVSILDGIRKAVSPQTRVRFAKGCDVDTGNRRGFDEAVALARQADAVVLVLGEDRNMSGEAASRTSLDLPGVQRELAAAVQAAGKPTVVVLTNGRPLAISWLAEHMPAIVEAWQLGTEMGNAVADVLFGAYNPSGKLAVTFPRHVGQVPLYYNHKNTGRPPSRTEKYTSKYLDSPWTPLYAFGHGRSYTTFEYSDLALAQSSIRLDESLEVNITVTNTGDRAGHEVVQLYLRDEVASVTRPVQELRGFRKIRLEPGESRTVTFTLTPADLEYYNLAMERVVEPGWFTVSVGGSSDEVVEARFQVVAEP